ncbi:serine/threonine-protein kinase [Aquisphaera insulae]|uniref:serine/threonine-protein kinase n=1 Tax=Aquisphaera insulae TaxID=2712864 RepID=UPI0013EB1CC4|nr:serine/threonine-protein kinase [Aquisphaera insulae]
MLRASWTDAERFHVAECPSCQAMERRLKATLADAHRIASESPPSPDPRAEGGSPDALTEPTPAPGTTGVQISGRPPESEAAGDGLRWPGVGDDPDADRGGAGSLATPGSAHPADRVRLGRYVLIRKLAQGGMASVFEAHDRELNRSVALKVSAAFLGMAHTPRLDRFLREARVAAGLDHPALLPIYEVGRTGDTLYIASRFVDGTDLNQRIQEQGPLPWREALGIVEQIAEGVAHAHERGIIHRDIKPSNILLDRDGKPYLADFGLARSFQDDGELSLTREGVIVGTPTYMAPEQAMGQVDRQGPAMDVYGLGATLYALLTGRPPFRGSNAIDTIRRAVETDPAPPRAINSGLPRDLDVVCMKAMARDPRLRHDSARALANDLRAILAGTPLPPTRSPRRDLLRWPASGRQGLPWALAATTILLVVPRFYLAGPAGEPDSTRASPAGPVAGPVFIAAEAEAEAGAGAATALDETLADAVEWSGLRNLRAAEQAALRDVDGVRSRHELIRALTVHGHCRALRRRPADAVPSYLRAIELLKALRSQAPDEVGYREELAELYRVAIAALGAAGRGDEAAALERDAAAVR